MIKHSKHILILQHPTHPGLSEQNQGSVEHSEWSHSSRPARALPVWEGLPAKVDITICWSFSPPATPHLSSSYSTTRKGCHSIDTFWILIVWRTERLAQAEWQSQLSRKGERERKQDESRSSEIHGLGMESATAPDFPVTQSSCSVSQSPPSLVCGEMSGPVTQLFPVIVKPWSESTVKAPFLYPGLFIILPVCLKRRQSLTFIIFFQKDLNVP